MIKSDRWITEAVREHRMIDPFEPAQVRQGNISYGLSSYGYDVRLSREFTLYRADAGGIVDPKKFDEARVEVITADTLDMPPHSFLLGRTVEYLRIPRRVMALASGKSTYARCGILVNLTPFEPEWEGYVTLGISNTNANTVRLYANEGIAQVLFFESDEETLISYKDRDGKYQAQQAVTPSKI